MRKRVYTKPEVAVISSSPHCNLLAGSGESADKNIKVDNNPVIDKIEEGNPDGIDAKDNSGTSWDW